MKVKLCLGACIFIRLSSHFQSAWAEMVRVGRAGLISDAGIYIALEKGYFKEYGIDTELSPAMAAGKLMASLATGDLDVVAGGVSPGFFNSVARGMPVVMVADKGSFPPGRGFNMIVVRKELWDRGEVRSVKDLKGRPVATNAMSSPVVYEWAKALEKVGLTLADVDLKEIAFGLMVTALEKKAIDAAIMGEPHATRAQEMNVGVILLTMDRDEGTPNMQVAAIFYSREFAEKKAELAKKWMVAYLKGVRFYNQAVKEGGSKLEELIQILIKHTGVKERKVYDKVVWAGLNPDGFVNRESMADQQKFYNEAGWVPETTPVEQFVDDSFVKHALQVLGGYRP